MFVKFSPKNMKMTPPRNAAITVTQASHVTRSETPLRSAHAHTLTGFYFETCRFRVVFCNTADMSNRCVVLCVLLAGFCFFSWKHSLIGKTLYNDNNYSGKKIKMKAENLDFNHVKLTFRRARKNIIT